MHDSFNVLNPSAPPPLPYDPETIDALEWQLSGQSRTPIGGIVGPRADENQGYRAGFVEMRLYVSENSLNCGRAAIALQQVLREFPSDAVHLRVFDVLHDIDAATHDRVLFTPTLIFTDQRQRKTRVLGDLSNAKLLWDLLLAAGLEPL